jgi:exonuclease VII large subunit
VLHRGYSVTRLADTGAVLRSVDHVRKSDWIETLLSDGSVRSQVGVGPAVPATSDLGIRE